MSILAMAVHRYGGWRMCIFFVTLIVFLKAHDA
jgi:hypothetical protein